MKKVICLILSALMLLSLAACSDSKTYTTETVVSAKADPTDAPEEDAAAPSADGIDVDLTAMSSTMVYSEVLNMQQTPDKYLGKVVKMHGPFSVTEIDGNRYFACIISDATACCSSGIEFDLKGDHSYPDDYPAENTDITVVGTFTTYMEGTSKYLQLKDAEMFL